MSDRLIQLIYKIIDLTKTRIYNFIIIIINFINVNYRMTQNILINKKNILTTCYNIVLYICMRLQNIIVIFIYVILNQTLQFVF